MISFTLKCENNHSFDSWFQSSDAFEKLRNTGMITCPTCASTTIEKSMMSPRVRTARKTAKAPEDDKSPTALAPHTDKEKAIAKLKSEVETNSEYVGMEFVNMARAIHDGDAPNKSIYGQAKPEEAIKLLNDGVPVIPLPFIPNRKIN